MTLNDHENRVISDQYNHIKNDPFQVIQQQTFRVWFIHWDNNMATALVFNL